MPVAWGGTTIIGWLRMKPGEWGRGAGENTGLEIDDVVFLLNPERERVIGDLGKSCDAYIIV
jgi:hypothetical protein